MYNNTSVTDIDNGPEIPWTAIYLIRLIGFLAIIANLVVLLCLIKVRKTFMNYDYWLQIVVMAGVDVFNGTASLSLSFLYFDSNYIVCSFILCMYMFSQVNTLCAMCCICVKRFLCLIYIDQSDNRKQFFRQDLAIGLMSVISLVYCAAPYFIWEIRRFINTNCSAPVLFGPYNGVYLLFSCAGVLVPLLLINMIYSVCLYKLWRSRSRVIPAVDVYSSSVPSASTQDTKDGRTSTLTLETVPRREEKTTYSKSNKNTKMDNLVSTSEEPGASDASSPGISNLSAKQCSKGRVPSLPRHNLFQKRRDAQLRAIKLLGIILLLADIATVIPFTEMLRQGIVSTLSGEPSHGGNALGISILSLNALVDAFVYGIYSREIRSFLYNKLTSLR